jgi:hypothetical protein
MAGQGATLPTIRLRRDRVAGRSESNRAKVECGKEGGKSRGQEGLKCVISGDFRRFSINSNQKIKKVRPADSRYAMYDLRTAIVGDGLSSLEHAGAGGVPTGRRPALPSSPRLRRDRPGSQSQSKPVKPGQTKSRLIKANQGWGMGCLLGKIYRVKTPVEGCPALGQTWASAFVRLRRDRGSQSESKCEPHWPRS